MENPIEMDDLGGKPPIFGNSHLLSRWFMKIVKIPQPGGNKSYTTQECHSTIPTFKGDSFLQSGIFRCHLIPFLQIPRCSGGEVVVSIEKLRERTGLLEKRSANTKLSCTSHNCILGMGSWTNAAVYSCIYTLGYRVANPFWSTRRFIHMLKNKERAGIGRCKVYKMGLPC